LRRDERLNGGKVCQDESALYHSPRVVDSQNLRHRLFFVLSHPRPTATQFRIESLMNTNEINIDGISVGGRNPLLLIAGPCVIASERETMEIAVTLQEIARRLELPFVFKASYDKANRSAIDSYRGPGLTEGLRILAAVKEALGVPILTDLHGEDQVGPVCDVVDIVQIPAFLCRQTDLIVAVAKQARAVNIKKGQFLAPHDMKNVVAKVESTGAKNILLTERGYTFGYNQLVADMTALPTMRALGYPVIFDATHCAQSPGGRGNASGGRRDMVPCLARAAVAAGCDGVFLEVHPDPDNALSDGPNSLQSDDLEPLLEQLVKIDNVVRNV
jgi:2-dehydro-3-deoxyphosphooctonate aldolase (KDO 8-P synthase)